jgi:hypothetical protein
MAGLKSQFNRRNEIGKARKFKIQLPRVEGRTARRKLRHKKIQISRKALNRLHVI